MKILSQNLRVGWCPVHHRDSRRNLQRDGYRSLPVPPQIICKTLPRMKRRSIHRHAVDPGHGVLPTGDGTGGVIPLLRKHNEVLAIGAIVFRGVLEAIAYILMVLCFLLLLTVGRQAAAESGGFPACRFQTWRSAALASGWLELLLAHVFSIGSIMINLLLFQMKIIPRWLSGWGLIGSFLYLRRLLSHAQPAAPGLYPRTLMPLRSALHAPRRVRAANS